MIVPPPPSATARGGLIETLGARKSGLCSRAGADVVSVSVMLGISFWVCPWMSRACRPAGSLRLRPVDSADTGRLRKWAVVSECLAGQDPERRLALPAAGRVTSLSRAGVWGGRTVTGRQVRSG